MAITPRKMAQEILGIYSQAEKELLTKIKNHISGGLKTDKSTLKEVTALRNEAEKILQDAKKKGKKSASQMIEQDYTQGAEASKIPASLTRFIEQANNMFEGSSMIILRETQDIYRQIQSETAKYLVANVEERRKTAQRMLDRFAQEGITGFVDKAGRRWDMVSYVEMSTRSISANASLQGHIDRQTASGRDLIVISDHAGECPVCRPWENKVLSISGNNPKYPSLATAKAKGLFHPNCRHTITGYIEGLTDLEPPPNGGTAEQYAYTQKQRYNERKLREWKRRETVSLDEINRQKAQSKIEEYNNKQKELLKEYETKFGMTLRREKNRENLTSIR